MDVEATVDTAQAVDTLEALLARVDNLDGFWRDLDNWWTARQTAWFASGKIPINAPSTIRRKGSSQGLVDTGELRAATSRNQPFSLAAGDATFGLRKGTPAYTLGILNLSGPRGAPKRNPVPKLTAGERRELRDLLEKYILKAVD